MNDKFDLSELAIQTKEYWMIPQKSIFHDLISLIISQKISFEQGREIRKKLYDYVKGDYTPELLSKISQSTWKNTFQIDGLKFLCIQEIIRHSNDLLNNLNNIRGIGIWTKKAICIMHNLSNDIFLFEDYYIRKQLGKLLDISHLSNNEANMLSKDWKNKTIISKFLWRIKDSGINKIKDDKKLEKEDFL